MESIRELYKIGRGPSSSHTIGPEKACSVFKNKNKELNEDYNIFLSNLSKINKYFDSLSSDNHIDFKRADFHLLFFVRESVHGYTRNF